MHGRARRAAADFEARARLGSPLERQPGPQWTDDDIDDVAVYLNARYYRLPLPRDRVHGHGLADDAGERRVALDGRHPLKVP